MLNPFREPKFLQRTKPKEETNTTPEQALEYQKDFGRYFRKLFDELGLNGAWRVFSEVTPTKPEHFKNYWGGYSPSLYVTASRTMCDYIHDTRRRLSLLTDRPDGYRNEKYSEREIIDIMRSKVKIPILEKELQRNDLDTAKRNILELLAGFVDPALQTKKDTRENIPANERISVGRCVMAEYHTLLFIAGKHSKQETGTMSIITDTRGKPLMLEKIGLGNPYSCISLQPVLYNGFWLEAGAIFGVEEEVHEGYSSPTPFAQSITDVFSIKECKGLNFAGYSWLSIPPNERAKVAPGFDHFFMKDEKVDVNYDWVTPEIIADFAESELARGKR